MELSVILTAIQTVMSRINNGDCECRCGGCCCAQTSQQHQQLAQYFLALDNTLADSVDSAGYSTNRRW